MKKIYLAIVCFFIIHSAFSQVNEYFLNNPQWKVKIQASSSGVDCTGYEDTYNYNENGDTIIGLYTYKKIIKKGIYSLVNSMCNPYSTTPYTNSAPSYFIRSAGKQMYIIEPGNTTEELLYDFNLNVGDTLPSSYTVPASHIITVTNIDSILTPFGYRKRYQLSGDAGCSPFLYEGIGSSSGFVEDIQQMFLSGIRNLLCFSLNDISYVPTSGGSCDMMVGIDDLDNSELTTVFPNPFSNSTTFQLNRQLNNASLNLYNARGEKVKSVNFSGESLKIERENLSEGIYYYQVVQENGNMLNGKVIIID